MMRGTMFMLLIVLAGALLATAGCQDDVTEVTEVTVDERADVTGYVMIDGKRKSLPSGSDDMFAYVSVSGAPVAPTATLNGRSLVLDPEFSIYGNGFGFTGSAPAGEDRAAAVAVAMGDLAAGCTVSVPGACDWLAPEFGEAQVAYGQDAAFTWTAAPGAEGYWLTFDFEVDYADTAGTRGSWRNRYDVFVEGTSHTVAAAQMLPPGVHPDSIRYFWGDGDLYPYSGPVAPGSLPNVTGDADGYVAGLGGYLDMDFYLGGGPEKDAARERDLQALLRERLLHR